MKKGLRVILFLVICMSLTACNKSQNDKDDSSGSVSTEIQNATENDTEKESEGNNIADWGVSENQITEKDGIMTRAFIKFPYLCGIVEGTGKIAYQTDSSLVIWGAEIDYNEPIVEEGKLENIFPAYFQKVTGILSAYRGIQYDLFEYEITSKELVTINDYEMCKYTGKHTFLFKDESKEIAFVAYATRLKTNDAIVYWMVLDETEDQSIGDVIESHADKMAQTLSEE